MKVTFGRNVLPGNVSPKKKIYIYIIITVMKTNRFFNSLRIHKVSRTKTGNVLQARYYEYNTPFLRGYANTSKRLSSLFEYAYAQYRWHHAYNYRDQIALFVFINHIYSIHKQLDRSLVVKLLYSCYCVHHKLD